MADMTYEELEEKMLDILEEVCGDDEVRTNRDEDLFALALALGWFVVFSGLSEPVQFVYSSF